MCPASGLVGFFVWKLRLTMLFVPLFLKGVYTPCMSFHIETKQLFPPYGPLPESAKPAIDILDLKDLLRSETSIASCIRDYLARLSEWEANTFISLALLVFCVVGSTLLDMLFLMLAALELAGFGSCFKILKVTFGLTWIDMARVLRKLSMLDVAMVGVYLVTVCIWVRCFSKAFVPFWLHADQPSRLLKLRKKGPLVVATSCRRGVFSSAWESW